MPLTLLIATLLFSAAHEPPRRAVLALDWVHMLTLNLAIVGTAGSPR